MQLEDYESILEPIVRSLRSIENSLRPTQDNSTAHQVLMRCREGVVYPYLDADYEGDPHHHEHSLLIWEVPSPIGLLLMSDIDGTIQTEKVKNRTAATIAAVRQYDRWQKVVNADRRRSESIGLAIASHNINCNFIRINDNRFMLEGVNDERTWPTIDEAIACVGGFELKDCFVREFIAQNITSGVYCWSYNNIQEAIDVFDREISSNSDLKSKYRVVDRLGSVVYDGI